ncbi:MAG: PIN domain-containing protein [Candidatus Lokiarchaeota archaeon]|nr:PIN domain-containing protein [Candidatus Lokiarchaeota archaeon]
MKKTKKRSVSIDASCLIAVQASESLSELFKDKIRKNWNAFCSEFALIETSYILCRTFGIEIAEKKMMALKESGIIQIEPICKVSKEASLIKCNRPIGIGDCLTIALAKSINGDAIFCNKERELFTTLDKKPFDVKIIFLEDII